MGGAGGAGGVAGTGGAAGVGGATGTGGVAGTGGCIPGTMICGDGFTPSRCNAVGTFEAQARCSGIQICTDGACTGLCAPSRPVDCVDRTTRRTCVDGSLVAGPCQLGYLCDRGVCIMNNT
jgi:hypothetical protein